MGQAMGQAGGQRLLSSVLVTLDPPGEGFSRSRAVCASLIRASFASFFFFFRVCFVSTGDKDLFEMS